MKLRLCNCIDFKPWSARSVTENRAFKRIDMMPPDTRFLRFIEQQMWCTHYTLKHRYSEKFIQEKITKETFLKHVNQSLKLPIWQGVIQFYLVYLEIRVSLFSSIQPPGIVHSVGSCKGGSSRLKNPIQIFYSPLLFHLGSVYGYKIWFLFPANPNMLVWVLKTNLNEVMKKCNLYVYNYFVLSSFMFFFLR